MGVEARGDWRANYTPEHMPLRAADDVVSGPERTAESDKHLRRSIQPPGGEQICLPRRFWVVPAGTAVKSMLFFIFEKHAQAQAVESSRVARSTTGRGLNCSRPL